MAPQAHVLVLVFDVRDTGSEGTPSAVCCCQPCKLADAKSAEG